MIIANTYLFVNIYRQRPFFFFLVLFLLGVSFRCASLSTLFLLMGWTYFVNSAILCMLFVISGLSLSHRVCVYYIGSVFITSDLFLLYYFDYLLSGTRDRQSFLYYVKIPDHAFSEKQEYRLILATL